jgi:hypothetical protein
VNHSISQTATYFFNSLLVLLPPPAAELIVQSDREQLDVAIVGVDCVATKWRGARAYRKGLIA